MPSTSVDVYSLRGRKKRGRFASPPTLLMRTVNGPGRSCKLLTMASMDGFIPCELDASAMTVLYSVFGYILCRSAIMRWSLDSFRPWRMTLNPFADKARAKPRPIPLLAPVTSAHAPGFW